MGNIRIPFEADTFYHVYNHGNGDDNIFRCDENYRYFLLKYKKYIPAIAETYAYCLMPNHFHFLIRTREANAIQLPNKDVDKIITHTFSNFFNSYTRSFNVYYNRKGSLFLDNFQRKKVETEEYLLKLIHYIHFNPVKHGFVTSIEDWVHSSYPVYLSNEPTFVEKEKVISLFGDNTNFLQVHRSNPQLHEGVL
jgi:putative transposase